MPDITDGIGVCCIHAPGVRAAVQIDAIVERLTVHVAAGYTIGIRIQSGNAAVAIEVTQLRGLAEAHATLVVGRAAGKLVFAATKITE